MYNSNCKKLVLISAFLVAFILISGCSKDDDVSNEPDNTPPTGIDTCMEIDPSYEDDIKPIIEASCAIEDCHVSGGRGSGIFESYDGVKDKVDNESLLRRAVTNANMPPASSSAPKPTAEQRNLIKCWIEDGALDN